MEVYYLKFLREEFLLRQARSGAYSLRAYARDLGVDPSTLGKILKAERPFPPHLVPQVSARLKLGAEEQTAFAKSVHYTRQAGKIRGRGAPSYQTLSPEEAKVVLSMEQLALLVLVCREPRGFTLSELALKLGLSLEGVDSLLQGLLDTQLIHRDGERFLGRSTYPTLPVTTAAPERAQLLQSAQRALLKSGEEGKCWTDVLLLKDEAIPKMQALCAEFIARMRQLTSDDGVPHGVNLLSFPLGGTREGSARPGAEYSRSH